MKTLRGIWYGIQLFWLASTADSPDVIAWMKRLFGPPPVCERCLGKGEVRTDKKSWTGQVTTWVETPCERCRGNGLEPR